MESGVRVYNAHVCAHHRNCVRTRVAARLLARIRRWRVELQLATTTTRLIYPDDISLQL